MFWKMTRELERAKNNDGQERCWSVEYFENGSIALKDQFHEFVQSWLSEEFRIILHQSVQFDCYFKEIGQRSLSYINRIDRSDDPVTFTFNVLKRFLLSLFAKSSRWRRVELQSEYLLLHRSIQSFDRRSTQHFPLHFTKVFPQRFIDVSFAPLSHPCTYFSVSGLSNSCRRTSTSRMKCSSKWRSNSTSRRVHL